MRSLREDPADVSAVRAFAKSEIVTHLCEAARTPSDPYAPTVISVVKNELARLPDFLDHHRRLGVLHFAMIDNASEDGSPDYLRRQLDVDLFSTGKKFEWRKKHGWIMQVIERLGRDRWYLLLDADEHTVFAECETLPVQALVASLARNGRRRARAGLVDMYSRGPIGALTPEPGSRLSERFPYFDAATYHEHRTGDLTARTGGPRQRLLASLDPGFRPALTKYPLFRLREKEIAYNPHAIWPPVNQLSDPCLIALKHYKFDEGFIDKITYAISSGVYWNNSSEYRSYIAAIDHDPNFEIFFYGSQRFESSLDFLRLGLITQIRSSEHNNDLSQRIGAAARAKRADLLRSLR